MRADRVLAAGLIAAAFSLTPVRAELLFHERRDGHRDRRHSGPACPTDCPTCPPASVSSSGSGAEPVGGAHIFEGRLTKNLIRTCRRPVCVFYAPFTLAFDVPVWVVKGLFYAGRGVGRAAAYPFRRSSASEPKRD